MRDQKYYKRLNQIRQKYSYLNEHQTNQTQTNNRVKQQQCSYHQSNPVQSTNQSNQTAFVPHNITAIYDQIQTRRSKDHYKLSTPKSRTNYQLFGKQPNLQIRTQDQSRNNVNRNTDKYIPCRKEPQSYRQEIPACSQNSSPIKQFKGEFMKSSPLRKQSVKYSPSINRQTVISGPNRLQPKSQKDRLALQQVQIADMPRERYTKIEKNGQNSYRMPQRSITPISSNQNRDQYGVSAGKGRVDITQFVQNQKYDNNIRNIDKIQEKIQLALNKGKMVK